MNVNARVKCIKNTDVLEYNFLLLPGLKLPFYIFCGAQSWMISVIFSGVFKENTCPALLKVFAFLHIHLFYI